MQATTTPTLPSNPVPTQLSAQHLQDITSNPWGRFKSPSSKTAYLFSISNCKQACQFSATGNNDDPRFRLLDTISIDKNNRVRAQSPGLTDYHGSEDRSLSMQLNANGQEISGQAYCLSPTKKPAVKPFSIFAHCGNTAINTYEKDSTVSIRHADIARRNAMKKNRRSQKKVMKCSANDELDAFSKENHEQLSPDSKNHISAGLKHNEMEWLHRSAYSLTPLTNNPQRASNLGAASKDDNTRMMVIEKFAHFFSQFDDVDVTINPRFILFNNSDVIKSIHYKLTLRYEGRTLTVTQNTECFSLHPRSHASDKLLITIAHALLQRTPADIIASNESPLQHQNAIFKPIKETGNQDNPARQNRP